MGIDVTYHENKDGYVEAMLSIHARDRTIYSHVHPRLQYSAKLGCEAYLGVDISCASLVNASLELAAAFSTLAARTVEVADELDRENYRRAKASLHPVDVVA